MAKASKPGNIAVSGIKETVTNVSLEPPADRSAAQMKASFGSRAARGFERTRRSKILPGNTEPEVLNGGK